MLRNAFDPWHLLIVLAIVLLVFGGAKLPELARGMGRSIRIFRAEIGELDSPKAGAEVVAEPADRVAEDAPGSGVRPPGQA